MATADLITELAGDIQDCYSAVNTKGGTLPQSKNTNNLATAIASIPSGTTDLNALIQGTLTEIENQYVTEIKPYAFYFCRSLTKAIFENVTALNSYAFTYCNLMQLSLPKCQYFYTGSLSYNASLEIVEIPMRAVIYGNCFQNDSAFKTLILRGETTSNLINANAFNNTPFRDTSGSGGTVYVPQALISTYEADTNWSALENCTFAAIEGSEYDDS